VDSCNFCIRPIAITSDNLTLKYYWPFLRDPTDPDFKEVGRRGLGLVAMSLVIIGRLSVIYFIAWCNNRQTLLSIMAWY